MSDNNYSEFFIEGGDKIVSSKTLKDYERTLEEEHFFRCHRRYLINLSKVNGYSKVDGGYVSMSNGDEVPIGRRRLRDFRQKFLA
jgi:two-component system LytT family response regulator